MVASSTGARYSYVALPLTEPLPLGLDRKRKGLLIAVCLFCGLGVWLLCQNGNQLAHNGNPPSNSEYRLFSDMANVSKAGPMTTTGFAATTTVQARAATVGFGATMTGRATTTDRDLAYKQVKMLVEAVDILIVACISLVVIILLLVVCCVCHVRQMGPQQPVIPSEQTQSAREEESITAAVAVQKIKDSQTVAGRAEHFTEYLMQVNRGDETFTTRYDDIVSELSNHNIGNMLTNTRPEPDHETVKKFAIELFGEIERNDAAHDPFDMAYLDAVWMVCIVLGAIACYQWLPNASSEDMSLTRRIGSYVFIAYAIGSLASVAFTLYNPDILSEQAYNFEELKEEVAEGQQAERSGNRGLLSYVCEACGAVVCLVMFCLVIQHLLAPHVSTTSITTTTTAQFGVSTTKHDIVTTTTTASNSTAQTLCAWMPGEWARRFCSKQWRATEQQLHTHIADEMVGAGGVFLAWIGRWIYTGIVESAVYPFLRFVQEMVNTSEIDKRNCVVANAMKFCKALSLMIRIFLMHIVPNAVSGLVALLPADSKKTTNYLSSLIDIESDPWTFVFRILLLVDTLLYITVLIIACSRERARKLLFPDRRLTLLKILKIMVTPVELIVVLNGFFGKAFAFTTIPQEIHEQRRAQRTRSKPFKSMVALAVSALLLFALANQATISNMVSGMLPAATKNGRAEHNHCTCRGGIGARGNHCLVDKSAQCSICFSHYHLHNGQCKLKRGYTIHVSGTHPKYNRCTCSNGVAATGKDCHVDKTAHCVACFSGYMFHKGQCVLLAKFRMRQN